VSGLYEADAPPLDVTAEGTVGNLK